MASSVVVVLLVLAVTAHGGPAKRVRRGFNNSGYGAYGRDSDERDASVSRESVDDCSDENDRGYSGSRELAYNRDGRLGESYRGGRSFSKASASASASATTFNQNHKTNIIS